MNDDHERRFAASLRQVRAHNRVLENHNADLTAERDRLRARTASLTVVSEPTVYGPNSPHSWFRDMYRQRRASDSEVRDRLARHEKEAAAAAERRSRVKALQAQALAERALSATPAERRALEAFTGLGMAVFERYGMSGIEQRAMTRTDGQGGYLVPPAWLIDRAVPAPRADAAFSSVVTTLPLPGLCDSVNLPRITTGTAAAVQAADTGPAASRDLADAFVSSNVVTISGFADMSRQWLDQGSGGAGGAVDAILWDDLRADAHLTLDGLLILGSGVNGQTSGLLPPQTAVGTSLAVYAPNGNTGAGQAWWYDGGSGTALGTTVAQGISGVTRARSKRPTHLLTHPWVWDLITSQTDQQSRPYVEPHGPHPLPPDAELPPGVVGYAHGLPILGDLNVPTTMGGSVAAPFLGNVNGLQFAGQPGTGTGASFTPVIPVVADDMFVFLGEPHLVLMDQVLSGTMQVRFRLHQYAAILVNRYQAVAAGTLANSGGWAVGACSSYGVVTQQGSNSLLSLSNFGG